MIKIIIFDFDGVIVDNYELHYELSRKQIQNLTREEHMGLFDGSVHTEKDKFSLRDTGFDLKKYFSDAKQTMLIEPQVKKAVEVLSEIYVLGIITSAKEYGVFDCLKYNNLDNVFSFVYGYETAKLKIDKFKLVFKEMNVTANECLFITDTLGDILEANEVGFKTVAVDFGYHDRERLVRGNPVTIVSNYSELLNTISTLSI